MNARNRQFKNSGLLPGDIAVGAFIVKFGPLFKRNGDESVETGSYGWHLPGKEFVTDKSVAIKKMENHLRAWGIKQ